MVDPPPRRGDGRRGIAFDSCYQDGHWFIETIYRARPDLWRKTAGPEFRVGRGVLLVWIAFTALPWAILLWGWGGGDDVTWWQRGLFLLLFGAMGVYTLSQFVVRPYRLRIEGDALRLRYPFRQEVIPATSISYVGAQRSFSPEVSSPQVGLLLRDSARIQEGDAERENRRRERAGREPVRPPYTEEDVERLLDLLEPLAHVERVGDAVALLGGAAALEDAEVHQHLRDPEPPSRADMVFLESTYGDRDHRPLEETVAEFERLVLEAVLNRGKILVPAFAVGRAQQLLYHLAELFGRHVVPPFPVYLDSPMAIAATEIYLRHPELSDACLLYTSDAADE